MHASPERVAKAPLLGRIFDADGQPMSPTFSYGKQGKLYRYYVSTPLQRGKRRQNDDDGVRRVSAPGLEAMLRQALERLTAGEGKEPLDRLSRIEVYQTSLHLLAPIRLLPVMRERIGEGEQVQQDPVDPSRLRLILPVHAIRRGGRTAIVPAVDAGPRHDPNLIRALRAAHAMVRWELGLPVLDVSPATSHKRRLVRLAFLAPELQRAILEGRQSRDLTLKRLMHIAIPLIWSDQICAFGAPVRG